MYRKNILRTIAFMLGLSFSILLPVNGQLPTRAAQSKGLLRGTVADVTGARISGATIIIKGKDINRKLVSAEDGTYKTELPPGIYRIRISADFGFCPTSRAAFHLKPATTTIFDFTLFGPNAVMVPYQNVNAHTVFDDGPTSKFKYESFPLSHLANGLPELMVRYGERKQIRSVNEYDANVIPQGSLAFGEQYPGVMVSYDVITIYANRVRFDREELKLEAEGNVIVEDGGKSTLVAKRAEVDFKADKPIVKILNRTK